MNVVIGTNKLNAASGKKMCHAAICNALLYNFASEHKLDVLPFLNSVGSADSHISFDGPIVLNCCRHCTLVLIELAFGRTAKVSLECYRNPILCIQLWVQDRRFTLILMTCLPFFILQWTVAVRFGTLFLQKVKWKDQQNSSILKYSLSRKYPFHNLYLVQPWNKCFKRFWITL